MIPGKGEALPASRPVAEVAAAAEAYLVRATEREARTPGQLAADLVHLRHAIDLLELEFCRDSAAFAAEDEYELQGSATAIDWIRHNCKMSGHAAAERVCVGDRLESLATSVEATVDARIGYAHLALMARTAAWFDDRPGSIREGELLAIAEDCSVSRFHHVCHHARHAGNPDEFAAEEAKVAERRTMTMTLCEDGGYSFGGKLDAAGGAALRTALEPLARKSGADDDRHKERRLADALVELAHHALDGGIVPQVAGQRPHLQVTASFDTLLGRIGSSAAEMEFSLPMSSKTLERIACDCNLTLDLETRMQAGFDSFRGTWTAASGDSNLQNAGPFAQPNPDGTLALGFLFRVPVSIVKVQRYLGRYYLCDGYHRSVALMRSSVRHSLVLFRDVTALEQLGAIGHLPFDRISGLTPPLLSDYDDERLSLELNVPASGRRIMVLAQEAS